MNNNCSAPSCLSVLLITSLLASMEARSNMHRTNSTTAQCRLMMICVLVDTLISVNQL